MDPELQCMSLNFMANSLHLHYSSWNSILTVQWRMTYINYSTSSKFWFTWWAKCCCYCLSCSFFFSSYLINSNKLLTFKIWCVCVFYVCIRMLRYQRSMLCVFLNCALLLFYGDRALTNPGAHQRASLVGYWALGILLCPSPQQLRIQLSTAISSFYVGTENLNSGPYVCTASTLLMIPSSFNFT